VVVKKNQRKTKPQVSVCCITYNHKAYIRDAIEGFLMQKTSFPIEILIHDDASTDGTAEIVKEYAEKHPDLIIPILQKENQHSMGVKISSTYLYPIARGKYIAKCEGDDFWTDPLKLQKQFDYMEKNSNFSTHAHSVQKIDALSNSISGLKQPYKESCPAKTEDIIMNCGGIFGTNSLFFRTQYIKNLPQWLDEYPVGDYPMQIYLSLNGGIYFSNEVMSVYRINVKNSWNYKQHFNKNHEEIRIKNLNHFIKGSKKASKFIDNYSYFFNLAVLKFELEICLLKGDINKIKSAHFSPLWNRLGLFKKYLTIFEYNYPNIYNFLKKLKNNRI